jgi:hypothetical protein
MRRFSVIIFGGATRSMLLFWAFLALSSLCAPLALAEEAALFSGDELVTAGYMQGDANGDDIVDSADLSTLLLNYGLSGPSATWNMGNFNDDGTVGAADLAYVIGNFGERSAIIVVPEPGTLALLAVALFGLVACRWTKRS